MSTSLEPAPRAVAGTPAAVKRISRLHFWALVLACLIYMVQVLTPLRLTGDSIVLLSIASSVADGHGFLDHGQKIHYPPGYPTMVVCLEHAGAARPWGLVGLNFIFLFIGLAAVYFVARHHFRLSENWAAATLLFASSSFALIKHFTLPLTDIPFFGISMVAVALLTRAETERGTRYYLFWSSALVVSIAAGLVRTLAIALIPCLVWSLSAHTSFGVVLRRNKRLLIGCGAGVAVTGGMISVLLLRTLYVQEALSVFARNGPGRGLIDILLFRVHEIGELVLNAPASKLGALAPLVWFSGTTAIAGLAACVRRWKLGSAEVYLMAYASIMILWPYVDTRFWVPVLPLVIAELFSWLKPWALIGWKRRLCVLYSAFYLLMGIAALSYSTWITFSGQQFPYRYGDDRLRPTYELFYYGRSVNRAKVNGPALEVLERYSGTRARTVRNSLGAHAGR